jgi:3-oxoacyl-[acyl-carrier-protein] synthase II
MVDIVVTGMGATTPLGGDVADTWRNLLAGRSGVTEMREEWAQNLSVRIAGRLAVDPVEVLTRKELRRLDRSQQVALIAAREAWQDAGTPQVDGDRIAVVVGTGVGGASTMLDQDDLLEERGVHSVSPFTIPMLMPNGPAAAVGLFVGARAGTHAPVSACASGAEAIAVGLAIIRSGRADIVVAGGTDACIRPLSISGFARIGALSTRNQDPAGASRPFDQERDGFVMGEGAGILVLETADSARARGVRPIVTLAGAGITSDAYHMTAPDQSGQVRAIRQALTVADLLPTDIPHVNAHATGTPTGDLVECQAIATAIGNHPVLTAVKSLTGHLLGGAGAVGAIVTALTVREGIIPATANLQTLDPDIKLDIVVGRPRIMEVPAALSNAFGFGGHNVVLAFTRA